MSQNRTALPACGALTLAVGVAAFALLFPGALLFVAYTTLRVQKASPGDDARGWP